jgi:LuxR family maltose regulon positive regulatory protein
MNSRRSVRRRFSTVMKFIRDRAILQSSGPVPLKQKMLRALRTNLPVFPADELFLERPRIHNLLASAIEGNALLIVAGEGYGKTFAVSSFLRQRSEAAIWIQLSKRDNQPWRFWENYTKAISLCSPDIGGKLREIGFPETGQQFNRWLEADRSVFGPTGKYVIVADDCHAVKSRMVLDLVERAFHRPNPNRSLIFICRSEPAINLVPFLSKGRLIRIGADELRFTEEEIAAYFRLRNINLSSAEIAAIHRDTEGWPLTLGFLATEIMKNSGNYTRHVLVEGAFRHFEDDLFAAAPKEVRGYLVKLSFFEQWPLDLLERTAAVLPERYRSMPALLAELENMGALIRYDPYLRGYRIHQVFLDYLREKQKDVPANEKKEISAIAAAWCLDNNLKMDAAINFERAGDCAGIEGIVDTFPRFVPRAAAAPLLDIIERLINREDRDETDEHFIYLRHVVCGRLLICLARFDEATAVFLESIRYFEDQPPSPTASRVLAESCNYMGIIALTRRRLGGGESSIAYLEKSNFYYNRHPWPVPASVTVCNVGAYVLQIGFSTAAGDFERQVNIFMNEVSWLSNIQSGHLSGLSDLGDLCLAELAYFQGDLDTAEQYARRVIIKAREHNQYEIENRGLFFLMRLGVHRGSLSELLEAWKQKDTLLGTADYHNRETINDVYDGWMYTQLGEPDKAPLWLRGRFETSELYSFFRSFESLVKAKYLYAEKRYAEAAAFLSLKEHQDGMKSYLLGLLEMNCLEASARYLSGEETAALALLEKTYEAAAPNSLTMPFIELGYDMRGLAGAALNAGGSIPRSWLEEIRSRASAYGKNLYIVAEQMRGMERTTRAIYLTRLERIVLRGLSRGQTREAIAAAAGQNLSAVKAAISRTCEKLGAVNRADAVRIASALGILERFE